MVLRENRYMEQKKSKLNIITLIISSIALVFTIVIGTLFFVNMGKQNKVTDNQYKMYKILLLSYELTNIFNQFVFYIKISI